jgi:hypothetical protein
MEVQENDEFIGGELEAVVIQMVQFSDSDNSLSHKESKHGNDC